MAQTQFAHESLQPKKMMEKQNGQEQQLTVPDRSACHTRERSLLNLHPQLFVDVTILRNGRGD